uniref:Uncharacterized protein n=1 Tax=Seriola dumerili TaxID=41447 RepID=A0A3B4V822_SERDU
MQMIKTAIQHVKKHPGVGCIIFMYQLSLVISSMTIQYIVIYALRPNKLTVMLDWYMLPYMYMLVYNSLGYE